VVNRISGYIIHIQAFLFGGASMNQNHSVVGSFSFFLLASIIYLERAKINSTQLLLLNFDVTTSEAYVL
jgi:hypothetical protein